MSCKIWLICLLCTILMDTLNACTPLDQGPFLSTTPTLHLVFDEASAADLTTSTLPASTSPYYSELRVSGVYGDNISLTIQSDNSVLDVSEYFQFVREGGKNYMKLIKALDRDGLTSSPEDDITFVTFTLICTSAADNISYDAQIFINDINDNRPEFPGNNSQQSISIKEATPVGTIIYQASATDKDANLDGNLTYTLVGTVEKFALDSLTGDVSVSQDLDYETTKSYSLVLTVKDGGPKVFLTATMTLQINITDSDDQGPAFDYTGCFKNGGVCAWPTYTVTVFKKDTPIQVFPVPNTISNFVQIAAYDLDIGIGNDIEFSIASTIPPGTENKFRIETARSGARYIASITPLEDMQVQQGYEIFLKAEEKSVNKRRSIAMILYKGDSNSTMTTNAPSTLSVCDSLDAGPYLSTNPVLNIDVDEATTEEIQAARLSGSMKYHSQLRIFGNYATGEFNLTINYDLIDPFYYFDVVTENGVNYMRLIRAVDRDENSNGAEQISFIPFTLTCTPADSLLSKKVYDVHIFIKDVNDNSPVFQGGNSSNVVRIPETTVPGTRIYTATAVDDDENMDGNLTYSLVNVNLNETFAIDPLTGDVTLSKPLDYESMGADKYFNLTLKVEDAGPGAKRTSTMVLQVYVTDSDDNGPAFIYTGCFAHKNVCAWPKYTSGLELKRNEMIKVYPVPNKVNGFVSINAYDLDTDTGNEIVFSIASTIPPGQENNFKVETIKGSGKEYTANVISLVDMNLSEGFEIFLKAEEKSENNRHVIAMILFTGTAGSATSQEQQGVSSTSAKSSGYSDLEIALIVVVAILAAFLVSLLLGVIIFARLRRHSSDKASFSTSM